MTSNEIEREKEMHARRLEAMFKADEERKHQLSTYRQQLADALEPCNQMPMRPIPTSG